jgi:D-sedoheptulose 7-phosphate isomerase
VAPATVAAIAGVICDAVLKGKKVLLFGNGGSAADAQHVAAELVGRFSRPRAAIFAIALTTDSSAITALANDFGFETIFERQVLGLASPGDVVIALSTSGKSTNVLRGLKAARLRSATTIGLTGAASSPIEALCDICFHAPSKVTPRIQELHILALHAACEVVDEVVTTARKGVP